MPGTGPGSEPLWAAYASPQFAIGTSYFRNVVITTRVGIPPRSTSTAISRARRPSTTARRRRWTPICPSSSRRGGKLLTYHGTTDGLIPYDNSVNYHEAVVEELGERRPTTA